MAPAAAGGLGKNMGIKYMKMVYLCFNGISMGIYTLFHYGEYIHVGIYGTYL